MIYETLLYRVRFVAAVFLQTIVFPVYHIYICVCGACTLLSFCVVDRSSSMKILEVE